MRVSIERLRVWLLVGAGLLVIVIAGFLEYAHLRAHRFLKNLPSRLGADITRESNGFTYSQSSRGKTVYTIHAAHMVQRKDGKTMLHDVGIVLYGRNGDRADRIYGSEFEYDQKSGVVRAVGEVHLDLQAPAPTDARGRAAYASGYDAVGSGNLEPRPGHGNGHGDQDERMVHVKTSGLVFVQSLGVASTDQEIEFQYHGMNGRAMGADYNSDSGVTALHSDVRVSGLRNGEPVLLTAGHAEMDRGTGELLLGHARYFAGASGGAGHGTGRVIEAEQATVHLRADGSVEHAVAHGGVSLEQDGGVLRGQGADVVVDEENRPQIALMDGGLSYTSKEALREVEGMAGRGTLHFDVRGRAQTAVMEDSVEMHVRERGGASLAWSERTVTGARIETRFASTEGRQWLRDGTVTGTARLLLVDRSAGNGSRARETSSDMRGDALTAQMQWDGRAARLSHLSGKGHTSIERHDDTGAADTSRGEILEVSFRAQPAAEGNGKGAGRFATGGGSISRAVQTGDVSVTHLPGRRAGETSAPVLSRATGSGADFEGDGETLTIHGQTQSGPAQMGPAQVGQAQVEQGDNLLRADVVTLRRSSGDATATGHVAVSYRQASTSEPVHVLAARAEFEHDAGNARFYGSSGTAARLWEGGSQVEAPLIELCETGKTLSASAGSGGAPMVRTVLAGAAKPGAKEPQVMRISSRSLHYSDGDRRAEFGGGVVLEDADGTVRAAEVVALLLPAAAGAGAGVKASDGRKADGGTRSAFGGGSVDRVTATGAVEVSEPGRHATGDRLVYTAADGRFVLTGSPAAPPRVVDEVQGPITGAALEFHAGDNSVMNVGDGKGGQGRRVHTETLVRRP